MGKMQKVTFQFHLVSCCAFAHDITVNVNEYNHINVCSKFQGL